MSSSGQSTSGLNWGFADQAVDVRRYIDALRRGAWLIATTAILFTTVAVAVSLSLPKSYQASARIAYDPTATLSQPTDSASIQRQLSTFQALINTPAVIQQAARQLSESPAALRGTISSAAQENANLITITATAPRASLAAARANAVAHAYVATQRANLNAGLSSTQAQLQSEINQLQGTPGSAARIAALQDRISALQISASGTANELQLAESATAPGAPASPRPARNAIIALFVSLLVGVLIVLARDQLTPRFGTPRELGRLLNLNVLVGIPYRRRLRRRILSGLENEAYDTLQASVRLLGAPDSGTQRTILITSAVHGEGKTTVVARLGRSLARAGQKTLLIAGDLRSPTLHQHLGLPPSPGLADCLAEVDSGAQTPHEAISAVIRTPPRDPNLDLLPAGVVPRDPGALMSSSALPAIIEAVREMNYDYVLIDSPPALGLGDTQFLALQADELLLVARLDRITPDQAEDLGELLGRVKLPPLGLVVVGARAEISPYYLTERSLASQS
jgi:polysaccharide biosynthesis transport protein